MYKLPQHLCPMIKNNESSEAPGTYTARGSRANWVLLEFCWRLNYVQLNDVTGAGQLCVIMPWNNPITSYQII